MSSGQVYADQLAALLERMSLLAEQHAASKTAVSSDLAKRSTVEQGNKEAYGDD
jgi:hypothetical protein